MDSKDRDVKIVEIVNRLNAKIAAQAANNMELYARQEIARELILRGQGTPELLILVLGDADTADAIVVSKVNPERLKETANDRYADAWTRFAATKIVAQSAALEMPRANVHASADDETEDDLPAGFNEEEDNLEFPEDESEVTEE
jgi:peptidyl-tRNA hydrolase